MSAIQTGTLIFVIFAVIGSLFFGVMARVKTTDVTAKNSNLW